MSEQLVRDAWLESRYGLGIGPDDAALDALVARYREPHRRYHDLSHLTACLRVLDGARSLTTRPAEVLAALLFHDAVYVPLAKDNEAKSAELAAEVLARAGAPDEVIARIARMILATRAHAAADDADTALMLDVDLSILAAEEVAFDAYERGVREEHEAIDDARFAAGRAAFVRDLLARPRLFATDAMHERLDAAARANLKRSLARWERVLRNP